MTGFSLKSYMPRSLYGRAALILITPVIFVQLVVGVVFIQNHFEGVTHQMTEGVVLDLTYLFARIEDEGLATVAAGPADALGYTIVAADPPMQNARLFYDVSIFYVIETLNETFQVLAFDTSSNTRLARLWLEGPDGPIEISFRRSRVSASNPHQLILWTLLAGGLMFLVALVFLRNQLRPIRQLANAAEAFGRGQVTAFSARGATEVRAAGTAFLDMRSRIERHIDQRTLMLSGVSHDLRTPLTRLRLGLEMLDEDTSALQGDVTEMERMLDEFLAFSRDNAEEPAKATSLADLLEDLVEDHLRMGHDVTLQDLPELAPLPLRRVQLKRGIDNLVSNALRYGTRARVSVVAFDRSVLIRVEDDGPGIPEAERSAALKAFSRLDSARNQNKGSGVGLGLAIATDVARAHGGSLRLGSSEDMGGLAADIVLPKEAAW